MEKELEILSHIQENEYITQREIAEKTGLSLGAVNLLLKKMIKTGFIKIERLNARTLRYILTPEGMKEKTSKTYHYIINSFQTINRIRAVIAVLLDKQAKVGSQIIYLYGPKDEIYHIIQMTIGEVGKQWNMDYEVIQDLNEIKMEKKYTLLIWSPETEKCIRERGLPYINILSHV